MDTDMDGGSGAAAGVSAGATTTSDEVIAQQLQVNLQLTSHRITPRLDSVARLILLPLSFPRRANLMQSKPRQLPVLPWH